MLPHNFKRPVLLIVGCGDVGLRVLRLLAGRYRLLVLTSTPSRAEALRAAGAVPLIGDLDKPGDAARVQWIRDEAKRIFEAYGNHPSMVLFSLGNELHGKYAFMQQLLGELQKADPRRLYTSTSNRLWIVDAPEKTGEKDGPPESDDFLVDLRNFFLRLRRRLQRRG